jgi:ABC-2 type transport system ATP-binding protein
MSIHFRDLTKVFKNQAVVDHINFSAGKGEILGLLGPNGAGKSTTMKMAACYISPTSGSIDIAGFDAVTQSLQARERVGYLPENNPLYEDLYVKEYLTLIAKIHKIKNVRSRVAEMIDVTGLSPEQHKKIGQLSKGYRQRVGIAQTIIHDPEVLIMDEPTTGLDPNQIIDIHRLIKGIGDEKTVILSTHIMQEVEAICNRVVIINHGRIAADSPISELLSAKGRKIIRIEFSSRPDPGIFANLQGIEQCMVEGEKTIRVTANGDTDVRAEIFRIAAENNFPVVGLTQEETTIEEIFRNLTNKPEMQ